MSELDTLAQEFDKLVWEDLKYARASGFKPPYGNRYEQMLRRWGAVETGKRLVRASKVQVGLSSAARFAGVDRTIEARMIEPRFRPLFSAAELAEAQRRIAAYRDGGASVRDAALNTGHALVAELRVKVANIRAELEALEGLLHDLADDCLGELDDRPPGRGEVPVTIQVGLDHPA